MPTDPANAESRLLDAGALPAPRHQPGGAGALALLHIELADLAELQASHGRQTMGELLSLVEARLTRGSRRGDRVERHRGEQFLCLLGAVQTGEQARGIAGRLLQRLGAPWLLGKERIRLRVNIGIALGSGESADLAVLHRVAEAALQTARRRPGGLVQFSASGTSA